MRLSRSDYHRLGLGFIFALGAARAEAHLVTTGMGPVYDGIGHFFLSPEDLIAVVGLAVLGGQRGPQAGRWALLVLPLAWVAGGIAGVCCSAPLLSGQISAACSFLLLGALIALDRSLPLTVISVLAFLVGAAHGLFNGLAMREAGVGSALLQLSGVGVMLFVLVAIIAGFVVSLTRAWARIVVRVAGSWIAATGLLLLGWSLRPGR